MENTASDLVTIAVEVIVALLVVVFIGFALTVGAQVRNSYQLEVDVADRMTEYAVYSKYDSKRVSGSDALEAIFTYVAEGFRVEVRRIPYSGINQLWEPASKTWINRGVGDDVYTNGHAIDNSNINSLSYLSLTAANGCISTDRNYNASLIISANGHVIGLRFVEI